MNDVYFVFKGGEGYLFNLNWFSINLPGNEKDLPGDCNLDGRVSIADAVMLEKWLLGASKEMPSWNNADLCVDYRINTFDLCQLRELLTQK